MDIGAEQYRGAEQCREMAKTMTKMREAAPSVASCEMTSSKDFTRGNETGTSAAT